MKFDSSNYVLRMLPFLNYLKDNIHTSAFDENLKYYGTGDSAHWPSQSNCNIFAGLATLGTMENFEEFNSSISQEDIRNLALALFRYILRTHLTGDSFCCDGKRWGNSWISVLGLERMSHGVTLMKPYLSLEDLLRLRNLTESEANWHLDDMAVVADIDGNSGKNHPESNAWSGSFLMRAAYDYPELPNSSKYREKATQFLLNAISIPSDSQCKTVINGKMVKEWHVGANFTENYGLDHHGYLNVGYMVITLSHLAMLHFYFKMRGETVPQEVYFHAKELWGVLRKLTFSDGRLLRIGGDTRARYAYCQTYNTCIWMMIADVYGDQEATLFEQRYLEIVAKEQSDNSNGSFLGNRLKPLMRISPYYYTRLESDFFVALSYGAAFRARFDLPQTTKNIDLNYSWQDDFAGGCLESNLEAIRSFVWRSAQGANGLCLPSNVSDMAEWQGNMHGELKSFCITSSTHAEKHNAEIFENGFITSGEHLWREAAPQGEGELPFDFAKHQSATVALADGRTMVTIERVTITKRVYLKSIKGFHYILPNDVYNNFSRQIQGKSYSARPEKVEYIPLKESYVTIENQITLQAVYGGELALYRSAKDNVLLKKAVEMPSMYAEEFVVNMQGEGFYNIGDVVIDGAYIATVNGQPIPCQKLELEGDLRGVEVTGLDNKTYSIIVNFGTQTVTFNGINFAPNQARII